jgi:two-component system response regulator FixJ
MPDDARFGYVVDDEGAVRRSLALLLGAAGYEVGTFETGEAFLEAATAGLPFGCVLLDLSMPFIEKPFRGEEILAAAEAALQRAASNQAEAAEAAEATERIATLSPREAEVLHGLVAGRQNKMIAQELGISPRTVEIHRGNLMAKLGVRSLPDVVRMALAAGIKAGPG